MPFTLTSYSPDLQTRVIKVWDLQGKACIKTFTHHTDKVQVVQWSPHEEGVAFLLHMMEGHKYSTVTLALPYFNLN